MQRHTRCKVGTCLKKVSGNQYKYRYNFPFEKRDSSKIEYVQKINKFNQVYYVIQINQKRNDPKMNTHNKLQLQAWRSNVDFQIIVDMNKIWMYVTKYSTKGEVSSKFIMNTMQNVL